MRNRELVAAIVAGVILGAGTVAAKEVNLDLGESYSQGDLTVTCGQRSPEREADTPMAINACQEWDDFNQKCLFEKKTFMYKHLQCVEECQHWDTFNNTCHYRTTCTFYPPQKAFVRTTCEKYDTFNNTCVQTRDTRIGR